MGARREGSVFGALTAFPTTAEQDIELLERGEGTNRFKLAVEYRVWKKAILSTSWNRERDTRREREREGERTDAVT